MKIAILSGKGGAGKTTITASLATLNPSCNIIDTDVEEPNLHLLLKNSEYTPKSIYTSYPTVDSKLCSYCGKCGDFCNFNAIIPAKNKVLVFEKSCHSCGGCSIVCTNKAIQYRKRELGKVYLSKDSNFKYGSLNIGEISGVKIIEELVKDTYNKVSFIDCPPGTSCSTVASLKGCDYAVVVCESSPFGFSDVKMVIEMLDYLDIPFGLIINKSTKYDRIIEGYCNGNDINILGKIPFSLELAKNYAAGNLSTSNLDRIFKDIYTKVLEKGGSYA